MRTGYLALAVIILMIVPSSAFILADSADAADVLHPAYDTLNDQQKEAYGSLEEGVKAFDEKIAMSGITVEEGNIMRDAFCSDHPEYFWFKTSYTMYYYTDTGMVSEFRADALDKVSIQSQKASLDSVVSGFTPTGSTYADKVRSIHDWIILKTSYDKITENSGNVYGTLVEGKARCEGYSYTMNYICLKYGIPCVYLSGTVKGYDEGHAWNILEMDNGKWYYVDATWDDPRCPIDVEYDYFLIGSSTNTPYGPFETSRTVDNDYGITASVTAYGYNPYPGGRTTDSISLTESDARANIGKSGNWYYSILDCKLFYDSDSMQGIADTLRREGAEYWSLSLKESESQRYPDAKTSKDYEIRMFIDSKEVSPEYLRIQGHLRMELPSLSESPLDTVKVYDSLGDVVSKENSIKIQESGTYTMVITDFDIMEHPIVIAIIVFLVLLLLLLIMRNRIKARRIRNGYKNPANAKVCRQCGKRIPKGSDFCPKCGNQVPKR